jgi:hypothetical protein
MRCGIRTIRLPNFSLLFRNRIMNIKNLAKGLVLLGTLFLLGCGGGGGDGAGAGVPTDPNTTFRSAPSGYFTDGFSQTHNYTGTDSEGGVYKATLSEQTQSQTTFLGVPAIPILGLLQLTNTANGGFVSTTVTIYYTTSASDRHYLGSSDSSTTTVSSTTSALPDSGKIGDFGVTGTYTDNAGNVTQQSWRIDDGFNGRAKLVYLSTTVDQFGALTVSTTTTQLIDTSGNVISEELVAFYADVGVTLTLNRS